MCIISKYESFKYDKTKSSKDHILDLEDLTLEWLDDGLVSNIVIKSINTRTFCICIYISDKIRYNKRLTYKSEKIYTEKILNDIANRLQKHNFILYKIDINEIYVTYKRYLRNSTKLF